MLTMGGYAGHTVLRTSHSMDYNRSMIAKITRSGNSFVIRVPREELQRVGVGLDDYVLVTIQPVEIRPRLPADLQALVDARLRQPETAAAMARLADG